MRLLSATLFAGLIALVAGPAVAQIPGLSEARRLLGGVPSLSSFLEGDPPITTNLDDARTEIAFLDHWSPAVWEPMTRLPRTNNGAYRLRPGRFALDAQSYCMHAGTHGPGGGDGYLYAPLVGPKAPIIRSLLQNSVAHPEVPQRDIQVLIWSIIARTKFSDLSRERQQTAIQLLSRDQILNLEGGALGLVPESVMREATGQLPQLARQVFEAEARLRSMLTSGTSSFADLERVAVLTGTATPTADSRPVPDGRWSFHPDGYFVRYHPSGYSQTRVEVSVPGRMFIARNAEGRIAAIHGRDGRRLEVGSSGVQLVDGAGAGETILSTAPPSSRDGGEGAALLARIPGARRAPADALRDLAELEALGSAVQNADAFDLLAEAWQMTFCEAVGCPSTSASTDVLVLRDGGVRLGDLLGCGGETCWFAGSMVPQPAIAWIGLQVTGGPPGAQHPDTDEVHLTTGTVQPGELGAVTDQLVWTAAGGYDRDMVEWIHLVGGEETPSPTGGTYGAPTDEPPPAEPPDDDEEEDEEDEDGPIFDPSEDVATPGNRSRQRLAPSGRPSGGDDGGEDTGEDDGACAGERRNLHQADALLELYRLQHAECVGTDPRAPMGSAEHCTGQLVYDDEEQIEVNRLFDSWNEALFAFADCLEANDLPFPADLGE